MSNEIEDVRDEIEAESFKIKIDDSWKPLLEEMEGVAGLMTTKIIDFQCKSKLNESYILSRVPQSIRDIHEKEYTPQIVAIGPYHRSDEGQGKEINPKLKPMEEEKLQFLIDLCKRIARYERMTEEDVLKKITTAIENEESNARNMYFESLSKMDSNDFVQMLILDGCYIFELMLKEWETKKGSATWAFKRNENNPVYSDLCLFENQIPFFILETIFYNCLGFDTKYDTIDLALYYLTGLDKKEILPEEYWKKNNQTKIHHLLHLLYIFYVNDLNLPNDLEDVGVVETISSHCFDKLMKVTLKYTKQCILSIPQFLLSKSLKNTKETGTSEEEEIMSIPTATQLHEHGVTFQKKMSSEKNYLNVIFKDGIMEIPYISLNDDFSRDLCNFLMLEQASHEYGKKFTSYIIFMNYLIDTTDDVVLLSTKGIIDDSAESRKKVAKLFNDMCIGLRADLSDDCQYKKLYQGINNYCKKPINKWRATLMHNYFKSPWSIIALIAGTLMLGLTLVSTVCALIEATKKESK